MPCSRCVPGSTADGHDYAGEAVERGAVAVLCENPVEAPGPPGAGAVGPACPWGRIALTFWDHPARAMRVVGVTGTNGKTTTCALLASIFEANGWPAGVIGTLTGERTTPRLQCSSVSWPTCAERGAAVAMEVSSHALDQYRVDGDGVLGGVFTNLSQDHLDYHRTMEAYFASKARLFTGRPGRRGRSQP